MTIINLLKETGRVGDQTSAEREKKTSILELSDTKTGSSKKRISLDGGPSAGHLGNLSRRKLNLELVRDVNESDACIKFQQNSSGNDKIIASKKRTHRLTDRRTDRMNTTGLLPTLIGGALIKCETYP